ncbi:GNAT family N-acetyltransferase [Phenylobacterium immobile]|uniref:GNAT family N-acetyltransferase n=1 Tax=Phenylobacterium immobile TaxID=21 RepID=UPI000AD91E7D|nr:GNAT family N-acetyltransferase [Phenylobacterium immobile]
MCSIRITPHIVSDRLALRPLSPRDATRIAALANDIAVAGMVSRMPHPYAIEDAQAFLAIDFDPEREVNFAIDHHDHGLIGLLGFHGDDRRQPELGYWLGRDFWGQGLATEATDAALVWASREWGKRAVQARHYADNPASGAVLNKAGFLYTGAVTLAQSLARAAPAPSRHMMWLA